jgi:chemotaxis protein CheD
MLSSGSKLSNIEAKIFGGAQMHEVTQEYMMVGKKNILIANAMLQKYRIPIVAQDIGGTTGRRISMDSVTGKVKMKYTQRSDR